MGGWSLEEERPSRARKVNSKRKRLWNLDPHCHYCRRYLLLSESTLDHVIPRSKGGSNRLENLVLACIGCNVDKADKMPPSGRGMLAVPQILPDLDNVQRCKKSRFEKEAEVMRQVTIDMLTRAGAVSE